MKLIEALETLNAARGRPETREYDLLCGFQPLGLATLLAAHLQAGEASARVVVREGRFGDLLGNLGRAAGRPGEGAAVVVEWGDLDPRLGLRHAGSWRSEVLPDVLATVEEALDRLGGALRRLAQAKPVALSLPSLAPPPLFPVPTWQAGAPELGLDALLAAFAAEAATVARLRVLSPRRLDRESPPAGRRSAKSELALGFPYTHAHADALARELARLLRPPAPKKGVITDLDDTLWAGILGEVGPEGVAWDLDRKAQAHGIYQALLAALASDGVLVAVVSKNEPALVESAFERADIRLPADRVFPIVAGWGPKSDGVAHVLELWNVGADSVVFVDDNALELAEVGRRFPEIECLRFPVAEPDGLPALLGTLRDELGKEHVLAEDVLRLESLRDAARFRAQAPGRDRAGYDEFLAGLDATIAAYVGREPGARALELINKTNQFNLNGRRYTESEWQALLEDSGAFVLTVDYRDRFGRLGTIAAVAGRVEGDEVAVERWVMSCRAFARRIEHATLRLLLDELGASAARLAFRPTERNVPLREFLGELVELPAEPATLRVTRCDVEAAAAPTHHRIERATAGTSSRG